MNLFSISLYFELLGTLSLFFIYLPFQNPIAVVIVKIEKNIPTYSFLQVTIVFPFKTFSFRRF